VLAEWLDPGQVLQQSGCVTGRSVKQELLLGEAAGLERVYERCCLAAQMGHGEESSTGGNFRRPGACRETLDQQDDEFVLAVGLDLTKHQAG
jgi:hypothetical protein